MKSITTQILLLLLILISIKLNGQNTELHHFSFKISERSQLDTITRYISIDNVKNNTVTAYANSKEWEKFLSWGIKYKKIEHDNSLKAIEMATTLAEMENWNKYPTYEVYEQMMQKFADDYPQICKLEEIGTLSSGRKILALKISDNVNSNNEAEPELLYTGTMHGDETTGYILLLRLIDYLLGNYGNSAYTSLNNLINNTEIWINPAANPDGTYNGGNSTVESAKRYNAKNIDLNRNFPQPNGSEHPDNESWGEETVFMMNFADEHHFSLAANFHGGIEVLNYPWDTWSDLAVDDNWWQMVTREYVNIAQNDSPADYLTALNNGITNGYAWYQTYGGRQDYMNYFHNCREVTIELSDVKLISTDELDAHWTYNKDALMAYLKQGMNGVRGVVTDGEGNPLDAKITVLNHDSETEKSWVTTDTRAGDYARYLKSGTYSLTFSADGFVDKTINNIVVTDGQSTTLNVYMSLLEPILSLNSDEIRTDVVLDEIHIEELRLSNIGFADLNYSIIVDDAENNPWITLDKTSGIISANETHTIIVALNANNLIDGTSYSCNIKITGDSSITIPVNISIYTRPLLETNKNSFDTTLLIIDKHTDSLIIQNTGNALLNYTLSIENPNNNPWVLLSKDSGTVLPKSNSKIYININARISETGKFNTNLLIGGDIPKSIPITLKVDTIPYFKSIDDTIFFEKLINESEIKSITLENIGGGTITYNTNVEYLSGNNWLTLDKDEGTISNQNTEDFALEVDCSNLEKGEFKALAKFESTYDTIIIPISLLVDTLPKLWINKNTVNLWAYTESSIKDTIIIANIGGGNISIEPTIKYTNGTNWLIQETNNYSLNALDTSEYIYTLDARNIESGTYFAEIFFDANNVVNVNFEVIESPKLKLNVIAINKNLDFNTIKTDTIIVSNIGGGLLNYTSSLESENIEVWAELNKTSGQITGGQNDTLMLKYNTTMAGTFSGKLIITTSEEKRIPIAIEVNSAAIVNLSKNNITFNLPPSGTAEKSIKVTNTGESNLYYELLFEDTKPSWLSLSDISGEINSQQATNITIKAEANTGDYKPVNSKLIVHTNSGDSIINVNLNTLVSINDKTSDKLEVEAYPNPFSSNITFAVETTGKNATLCLYNILGEKVAELSPSSTTNNLVTFIWNANQHYREIPKGSYLYKINCGNKVISGKIQKL